MRILLWYWGRKGAGGQFTLSLAEALAQLPGVSVALSVSAQADLLPELRQLGLPMQAVPTYASTLGFLAGFGRVPALRHGLVRQAREIGADVVVSTMTHLWTPLVAPALPRAGLPFVPLVHDAAPHPGDFGLCWDWRLDRELDAATGAVAMSDAVLAALQARRPGLRLARMPLGAHLPAGLLRGTDAPPQARTGTRFLLFGRLRAYKGLDLVRDAWPLLRASCPEATLRIVGEGDVAALAPGLAELPGVRVESRWVAEAEIPQLISAADALVLPYREASQSGVVSLSFALGVPVVATAVGGLAEQVTDGVNGVLVPRPEAPPLAAAMARLCDPSVRASLAEGAARSGRALTDWVSQARQLQEILAAWLPS